MIVTSDFTNPGVYYGEASKVNDSSININFVIEVRRDKGINLYFESNDDVIEVKAFSDKNLKWKADDSSKITSYTTTDLTVGNIYVKLRYIVERGDFELFWGSTSTLNSVSGSTGNVHSFYLPDATEIYPPTNHVSKNNYNVARIVFFIIAVLIAIIVSIFTWGYISRYLFFS